MGVARMPAATDTWFTLYGCLWDHGRGHVGTEVPHLLPGVCLREWAGLINSDYDAVDALYLDADVIGG